MPGRPVASNSDQQGLGWAPTWLTGKMAAASFPHELTHSGLFTNATKPGWNH